MCGIAGAVDLTGQRRMFSSGRLEAMVGAIAHRGPDDEHIHFEPGVALGARRLSIVDLAGGRQPIANETGSVWVAFNGELFEYPELRKQLLARGHRLETRCDTEAWVHLYEDHGQGMFERARGQFAVSLWDRAERTLILGRDRVGICPLYYAENEGWLLWGSEIKALLASGLIAARPDVRGIDHVFSFFCSGTTRTCFEGITSIPPGHYLHVRDGRIELKQYWDFDFPDAGQEQRSNDVEPLIDEFEHLLRKAVERRLRGDVPVVSYISGGLDSTVVLGLCSRERGCAVPSFTIGLDNAGPDERREACESAKFLNSPLTMVTLDKRRIAESYPELVAAAEVPVLDTSCAALMQLARAVHEQGYKVALTGEGADEALAGYYWFKNDSCRNRYPAPICALLHATYRTLGYTLIYHGWHKKLPCWRAMNGARPAQQLMYEFLSHARPILFSSEMWDRLGDHDPFSDLGLTNPRMSRWDRLNQSLYVGYKVMLPGLLLFSKGDRVAMHSSVETRYPFLDDDVIAFCGQLAPEYKLRNGTDKWLLRQVAARALPSQIANRPKTMFNASKAEIFLGPGHPQWVDELLSEESLRKTGYFDPRAVRREVVAQQLEPAHRPRRRVLDVGLTNLISTQLWHHLYCGGGLCGLPTWSAPEFAVDREPADLVSGGAGPLVPEPGEACTRAFPSNY